MSEPTPAGPPPNPRADRQRRLIRFLQVAAVAVFALALLSLVLPGTAGRLAADVMVVVVVGAPVVRVLWLLQRWIRRRDWRFVGAAAALLLVVGAGAALGLLTG
jgi:membrane protein YdbS with pleckstrin-like domain